MKNDEKRCLNCGTTLTDAFCPHCGQRASVGRLSVKTAIVDNAWSAVRMDRRVIPTSFLLVTRPWIVIRDYIKGRRVIYTQPVRLIVIMCFVNIIVQMLIPGTENAEALANTTTIEDSLWSHIWHGIQDFLKESEVATDMIDSVIVAPVAWLLFMPWGSRRFNFAEYSTAYLYLCSAGLIIDFLLIPVNLISDDIASLIELFWWLYLLNGLVKRSFHIRKFAIRAAVMCINTAIIIALVILNRMLLFGFQI